MCNPGPRAPRPVGGRGPRGTRPATAASQHVVHPPHHLNRCIATGGQTVNSSLCCLRAQQETGSGQWTSRTAVGATKFSTPHMCFKLSLMILKRRPTIKSRHVKAHVDGAY